MVKYKKSKQREAILEMLRQKDYHPTVDDLYHRVRLEFPKISLATVYRNVEQLCQMGKIWKVDVISGPARYDGNTEKHFHLTCDQCGEVMDVWIDSDLAEYIDLKKLVGNFTVNSYKIDFFGTCSKCGKDVETDKSLL